MDGHACAVSIVITEPLAHSPPANNPCVNLKIISNIGDSIPAVDQVGSKPVKNVTAENPRIVIIIAFFLPCLSPKFPKIAPPTGRITSAMVYVWKKGYINYNELR
jgi:hypothetical protein